MTARPATRDTGVTQATRGVPVDEHRAAAALPLRRAAVLRRNDAEPLAEHREERLAGRTRRPRPMSPLHVNATRSDQHRSRGGRIGVVPFHDPRRPLRLTPRVPRHRRARDRRWAWSSPARRPGVRRQQDTRRGDPVLVRPLRVARPATVHARAPARWRRRHQVRERAAACRCGSRAPTAPGRAHPDGARRAGLPKGRGVYHSLATFGQAGIWDGEASSQRHHLEVLRCSSRPPRWRRSRPAGAPRGVAHQGRALGVKPICTRVPQCPLHTVSLSDVVGTGKPVAVLFATPALCASQYCGPVLDELLAVMEPVRGDVTFVHVDIYKNLTGHRGVAHGDGVGAAERAVALHDRRRRHDPVAARHRVRRRTR